MMVSLGAEVVLVDQLPGSIPGHVSGGDLELVEKEANASSRSRRFQGHQFNLEAISAPIICTLAWIAANRLADRRLCDFAGTAGSFRAVRRSI
jgi:cysteine synthase A